MFSLLGDLGSQQMLNDPWLASSAGLALFCINNGCARLADDIANCAKQMFDQHLQLRLNINNNNQPIYQLLETSTYHYSERMAISCLSSTLYLNLPVQPQIPSSNRQLNPPLIFALLPSIQIFIRSLTTTASCSHFPTALAFLWNQFSIAHELRSIIYKMSNLQAEIAKFTANEALKKSFTSLYRLIKTHNLLKNLYLSEALNRDIYSREIKQTLERISMVKQQLKAYDINRFCELWGITTEYEGLNFSNEALVSSIKVPIGVAKLANLLPRLNDDVFQATKYEEIHEIFSTFCTELNKLKQSDSSITASFKKIINDLIALESRMAVRYDRLTEEIDNLDKDMLREGLTKFGVQFQKSYNF